MVAVLALKSPSICKAQSGMKWILLIFVVLGIGIIGLIVFPFSSKMNQQQHIGTSGGPGYTWIGDLPLDDEDPYDLKNFGLELDGSGQTETQRESEDRVMHTLDFNSESDETDEENGLDSMEKDDMEVEP